MTSESFPRSLVFWNSNRIKQGISSMKKVKLHLMCVFTFLSLADDNSLFIGFVLSGSFGKYEPNTHIKTEPSHQTHSPQSNSHERPQAVSTTDTFNSKQLEIKKASTESIGSENVRQFRLHSSRKIFGSNTPIVFNNFATEPAEEASGRSPTSFMSNLSPKSQSAQRVQGASIRIVKDLQNELTALVKKNNKLSKFFSEGSCLVNRTGLISPGETFGERSVSLGEQRRNSMVCLADGNALILPSEYFRKYFQKGPVEVEGDKVYFLKSLLKDITIEKAKQLAQHLEEITIQPRTVIFSATDTPDALYFVKSGKVHVSFLVMLSTLIICNYSYLEANRKEKLLKKIIYMEVKCLIIAQIPSESSRRKRNYLHSARLEIWGSLERRRCIKEL